MVCRVELTQASCPKTWDAVDKNPPCNDCRYFIGEQDGIHAFFFDCNPIGNGGTGCFYDATAGQLVGAWELSDVPTFCGGSSVQSFAGSAVPQVIASLQGSAVRACSGSDAGTDADATD
jgi:hypothetical protein